MLYVDNRRIGDHGIGRFTRQVLIDLEYQPIELKSDPNSPLDPFRLALHLRRLRPGDLFFSPGYNPPVRCPVPFLYTLHDLNYVDRPESSSPLKRLYFAAFVKRACREAACVLTVSEFSRGRIVEWSGISPDKVVNVGSGVGPAFNLDVAPYRFRSPFILCSSNRKKHKNEFRQIEAFSKSGLAKELALVFTGDPTPELADCIRRNGVAGSVHFLGRVPDEQLPSLYRGAEAVTFVSLYEGFGLPVVEAMACGTPVLTSNTTALPEVAGDAALLANPTSVEEMSHSLARIVRDAPLRKRLREAGLKRAKELTWEKTRNSVHSLIFASAGLGSDGAGLKPLPATYK